MSSSDNPQFEPRPLVSVEPPAALPVPPDPFTPTNVAPSVTPDVTPDVIPAPVIAAPVRDPVWSGWDVWQIAGLSALLILFVVPVVVVSVANLFFYPHEAWLDVARKPALAILSQFLAYVAIAPYMIVLVKGKYHQPFWQAIKWSWPKNAVLMLLLGMFTVSLDLLSKYLPMPKTTPFDQFFVRPSDAYLIVVFAITLGPLMEELFFRGFLYPVLARSTGVSLGMLLTALLFGLIHYPQYKSWAAVLVITLVGVVLTTVRAVTKSVAASFLVHVGYNGTLMALAALATDGFRHMEKAAVGQIYLR